MALEECIGVDDIDRDVVLLECARSGHFGPGDRQAATSIPSGESTNEGCLEMRLRAPAAPTASHRAPQAQAKGLMGMMRTRQAPVTIGSSSVGLDCRWHSRRRTQNPGTA